MLAPRADRVNSATRRRTSQLELKVGGLDDDTSFMAGQGSARDPIGELIRGRWRSREAEDLRTLLAVAHRVTRGQEPLGAISAAACALTGALEAAVWLPDAAGALRPRAVAGATGVDPAGDPPAPPPAAVRAHECGHAVVENLAVVPIRCLLAEPALLDDRCVGVLTAERRGSTRRVSRRHASLMTLLAVEVAMAVEREEQLVILRSQAHTDALTGALNRRGLNDALQRETERARRTRTPLSVVALDLDDFKAFNDRHGHSAGDALLGQAVLAWNGALREPDMLARPGGDEFTALLPDCDLRGACEVAARLRAATPEGVRVSTGSAEWDGHELPESALHRADEALYATKRRARHGRRGPWEVPPGLRPNGTA